MHKKQDQAFQLLGGNEAQNIVFDCLCCEILEQICGWHQEHRIADVANVVVKLFVVLAEQILDREGQVQVFAKLGIE